MKVKLILLTLLTCLTFNSFSQINRFGFKNDSVYLDSTNIGYLSTNSDYVYPYLVLNFKTKKYLYPILGQYILNEYMRYNKSITNIKYGYRYTDKSITLHLTKKEIIYIASRNLKESKDIKLLALGGGIILSQFLLSSLVYILD
jgi:hypothetical protein